MTLARVTSPRAGNPLRHVSFPNDSPYRPRKLLVIMVIDSLNRTNNNISGLPQVGNGSADGSVGNSETPLTSSKGPGTYGRTSTFDFSVLYSLYAELPSRGSAAIVAYLFCFPAAAVRATCDRIAACCLQGCCRSSFCFMRLIECRSLPA